MKHLIRTTILMLAILLPAIAHASQSLAEDQGNDVALPNAPELIFNISDYALSVKASNVEGSNVVLYECSDENGNQPFVINNPHSFSRDYDYEVYVYAVATNDAGSTSTDVTRVIIPKCTAYYEGYGIADNPSLPYQFKVDGIFYYKNGNEAIVTYYNHSDEAYTGDITIPETVTYGNNTYSVTTIGASAFRNCSELTSVHLPNSIKKISNWAFYGSGITSVNIPSSVTYIGREAFQECTSLETLYYNAKYCADFEYYYYYVGTGHNYEGWEPYHPFPNSISVINIGDQVIKIPAHFVAGNKLLTSLNIPDGVRFIGGGAFSGCKGLTNVTIPNSVTSIGSSAFYGCTELTSVTIPNSVTSIEDGVFAYCSGLNTINVDSNNTVYDSRDNCNAIINTSDNELIAACKNTVISSSVTSIRGMYPIIEDYGSIRYIGYGAFSGINMDELTIPVSVTNIGHGAFDGSYIKTIYFNSLDKGVPYGDYRHPFTGCRSDVFVIGSIIKSIPEYFVDEADFSSLVIPNSVKSIGYHALYSYNLTSIYLLGEGEWEAGSLGLYGSYGSYGLYDSYHDIYNLYIDAGLTSVKGLQVAPVDVYCYATTPPQCNENTFTDYSGTLHVPAASIASYFTAPYWCNFANIVSDDFEVPNSITMSEDSIEIKVGKTFNLTATVIPMNTLYNAFTMWQSSDNDIASVANGIVTGLSEGECDITLSCLGKKAICHVEIVCPISSLSLDQTEVTIEEEKSFTLTATILPESESNQIITWYSSNTDVAVVNRGLVTAIAEGQCDITATCLGKKAVCHVIVTKPAITITLDQDTAMVLPNHIITLTPSATPVIPESFTASSSDPSVAAPRIMNGTVQVVGIKEGIATITVGSADGTAVPATCLVTVYTEPGDVNCDGFRNISDVTSLINYLLSGDDSSIKVENADLNVDGKVAIGDVTALISGLLSGEWPSVETDDHEWVDLGLPSGTLWATCNVGASAPEEFGDYFAWGETTPRDFYDWSAYNWSAGSSTTMTKYCTSSSYGYEGFTDGKTELDLEDDAAYVNWGKKWRMPTYEQYTELHAQCTWSWRTQNGVKGYLVTGPNGNTMFMPAAGYHSERAHYSAGTEGRYWLSTLYSDRADHSYCLYFNSGSVSWDDSRRYRGFSVRAVRISQH